MNLPLDGVRVLDLTRALAGPFCTTLLGDLGADVLKVEPPDGDMIRKWGPFDGDTSLYHLSVNRNKRSLALNLRCAEGKALLHRLAADSDVLVENFRPGIIDKLGFDQETLRTRFPHLTLASVTGFGSSGPQRDDPSFDQIAQGMAGLMSVTGMPESGPTRVGIPIADLLSGTFSALGIMASLVGRERGIPTRSVETSLLESVLGVLTFQAQRFLSLGEVPKPAGNDHPVISPYGVFATSDLPLNLAIATESQWRSFCRVIEAPELVDDSRFGDGKSRHANSADLRERIESCLKRRPAEEWTAMLRDADLAVGPILDMAGTFRNKQVQTLDMIQVVEHPDLGLVPMLRGPLRIDGRPVPIRMPAPLLGQHSREVLEALGVGEAEVDSMIDAGIVVGVAPPD